MGEFCSNFAMMGISTAVQVLGFLYLLKIIIFWTWQVYKGLRTYVLPNIWDTQGDFKTRFGKWALVTGCTGGMGKEYANALAKKGMSLVLVSRSRAKLDVLATEIEKNYGVETRIIVIDFTRVEDFPKISEKVKEDKLDLGIVVNNVGSFGEHAMPFLKYPQSDLINMININCTAATVLCHDFLPDMKDKGRGAIINISSQLGSIAVPIAAVYCSTKHYMKALTKALQMESGGSGVIIQDVLPGMVETELSKYVKHTQSARECPTAKQFVESALSTLGNTQRTTGWWCHSLQMFVMENIPEVIGDYVLPKVMENMYQETLLTKEKM